jgi:hypothetical protein
MSVYGLAKCTARKLNNAACYKKEILQPTRGELEYSHDQLVPGLDQLLGIGRREQVVRILPIMFHSTQLLSFTELFQSMHLQILPSEYRRKVANDTVGAKSALGIRNLIYEGVNLETREAWFE